MSKAEKKERMTNFGLTLPTSHYRQLQMQAWEADMEFQPFMRQFIADGLSTLPEMEYDVKTGRKMTRKERLAGR